MPVPEPVAPDAPDALAEEAPDDALFEVRVAETGYRLRLDADNHWFERWSHVAEAARPPFTPTPAGSAAAERARAQEVVADWTSALGPLDGQALGPFVAAGTRAPNGISVVSNTVTFAVHGAAPATVTVRGDLRVPASLGPLGPAWERQANRLFGPQE